MKTFVQILDESIDRRVKDRPRGKSSIQDNYYIFTSIQQMVDNVEKEKNKLSKSSETKTVLMMIDRFLKDLEFETQKLKEV